MSLIVGFFSVLSILTAVISVSSASWVVYWTGMEMAIMSLFPVMFYLNNSASKEAALKYLLAQTIAGIFIFIAGGAVFMMKSVTIFSELMLTLSLLLKLGMFPFHIWVVPVIKGSGYFQMMLILVPLKIPALALLSYVTCSTNTHSFLFTVSVLTMMMGAIMGNGFTDVRKLMAASSITHTGWLAMGSLVGTMWLYFNVYAFVLILTLTFIWSNKNFWSCLMIVSLSGLPPFLLFMVKAYIILLLYGAGYSMYFLLLPMLSAVLSLNFYLKLSYSFYFKGISFQFSLNYLSVMVLNLFGGLILFYFL